MRTALKLKPNEIHLWVAFPDEIRDPKLLRAYEKLMSPQEQARHERFRFEKDRHLFRISRALIRSTLSRYHKIVPHAWRFVTNTYGRPEIERLPDMPPLRFSISHTKGIVACGFVLQRDIGVDVENLQRSTDLLKISEQTFSRREHEDLMNLPEEMQPNHSFHYWTLKESFIKAQGKGLSFPLQHFSFHISKNEPLRISFDAELNQNPDHWQFWLLRPTDRHSMALSLCKGTEPTYDLKMMNVVPLMEETPFYCPIVNQS